MPHDERSRHITDGVARAPNRARYDVLGYQASAFANPMIGVANGHSTVTPRNSGLQRRAGALIREGDSVTIEAHKLLLQLNVGDEEIVGQ